MATKKKEEQIRLRDIFAKTGMIDRFHEAPVFSNLHEYASRPMPIPPGKFKSEQSQFDGKKVNEIFDTVQNLSKQRPASTAAMEPLKKKGGKTGFVISGPSQFRKGF